MKGIAPSSVIAVLCGFFAPEIIAIASFAVQAPPVPTLPPVSSDGARVPPLTSVTDSIGAVWTLPLGTGFRPVLRNGTDTGGAADVILMWRGQAYIRGVASWGKWQPTASGNWADAGPVDPSSIPGPPITPPTGPPQPPISPPTVESLQIHLNTLQAAVDALRVKIAALEAGK